MPLKIALAGNPNVGKSSLFNALTGANQHTGNWTGKTVELTSGEVKRRFTGGELKLTLVDLPGCYSLSSESPEEEVARDFILSGEADATVIVVDACTLERGLTLALQILELTPRALLCLSLADEAESRGITVDTERLSELLGMPVVLTSSRRRAGLDELVRLMREVAEPSQIRIEPPFRYSPRVESELSRLAAEGFTRREALAALDGELAREARVRPVIVAESIAAEIVGECGRRRLDRVLDSLVTSRIFALPIFILLLAGTLWLTIVGSSYPSRTLESIFANLLEFVRENMRFLPELASALVVDGMLATLFTVVAVMLPPMAIFFPLFTLLEDSGIFARIAFVSDLPMRGCGSCGKASLTYLMGLGCNSAGVVGCRIIDSRRERLAAILTNAFVPCNGRLASVKLQVLVLFTKYLLTFLQNMI